MTRKVFTKNVNTNGNGTQNHAGFTANNPIIIIVDTKKMIAGIRTELLESVMRFICAIKIRGI